MTRMTGDYGSDYQDWLLRTARLIREHRWQELDAEHLADEVEDLGKSERRGITSQLTRLLVQLLKWHCQPARRSDSWRDSIADARLQIQLAVDDSPSLRGYPAEQLAACYEKARRAAARQTGLAPGRFPASCPFTIEDILSDDWLPEASG
jgi:hypothetical protein